MLFGEEWKALLREVALQVALTSEEWPNGKANTVITKAPLQGAACSESAVLHLSKHGCVCVYFLAHVVYVVGVDWST